MQAIGRMLRPSPGKLSALLLDYGRVIENLGDVYDIDFRDLKKKRPLARLCPICSSLVKKTICDCGFEFFIEKRNGVERMVHLTGTSKSDVVELFDVFADKYRSKNDNDCIKIRYYSDLLTICATDYFPSWKLPMLFSQLNVKDEKEFWDTRAFKRIKKIKIKKVNGYKNASFVLVIPPTF
jgi:superfamily II DNA or RNA helicase